MITHHPPIEMLFDYATGSMSEGIAIVVAGHLAFCSQCRQVVADIERIGGASVEAMGGEEVSEQALNKVLSRLDEPIVVGRPGAMAFDAETEAVIPQPVRPYVGSSMAKLPWRRIGGKIQEARLPTAGSGIKVALLRIQAGALMPTHSHRGHEYTLVLTGAYSDKGQRFARGDFDAKDVSDLHQPKVDDEEECLCLVALDAPLKLTGVVGRLLNPFLRI